MNNVVKKISGVGLIHPSQVHQSLTFDLIGTLQQHILFIKAPETDFITGSFQTP